MWITQAHPATGAAVGGHGTHLEDPQCGWGATQPVLHEAFPTPSPGGEPTPPDLGQNRSYTMEHQRLVLPLLCQSLSAMS